MADMTLEQVRDWLNNCAISNTPSSDISNEFLGELADAIDAAIKQREPPTVTFAPPETEEDVMAYLRIARLHVKHAREFLQKAMESGQ